jgi:hypothetical protein
MGRRRNSTFEIGKAKSAFPDNVAAGRNRRREPGDARLNAQRLEVSGEKRETFGAITLQSCAGIRAQNEDYETDYASQPLTDRHLVVHAAVSDFSEATRLWADQGSPFVRRANQGMQYVRRLPSLLTHAGFAAAMAVFVRRS